jgi:hypothetical protein
MSALPRLLLRCPYCAKTSERSIRFVRARHTFVCNHCHEVAWINRTDVAHALMRLNASGEARAEVLGGALGF